jgi:hypothetical protein
MAIAGANCQEILVKPRLGRAIEQPPHKLRAMATQYHLPVLRIAEQRTDSGPINGNFDRIKSAQCLFGEFARMGLVTDAGIAAKTHASHHPGNKQDRGKRCGQFRDLE